MKWLQWTVLNVALLVGCGDCGDEQNRNNTTGTNNTGNATPNNTSNNASNGSNNGSTGRENVLSLMVPPDPTAFPALTIAAGTPVRIPLSFTLPTDANIGSIVGFSVDAQATADAMTIVRTDGGTTANPAVRFRLAVAEGSDAMAACDGMSSAVDLTVTGTSPDFSTKTAVDTGDGAAALDEPVAVGGAVSACFELEASVDVQVTAAAAFDIELDAPCVDEPPQDLAGTWAGTYTCGDSCSGDEGGEVSLTILQAGETALYFDDGGAFYLGSVCANEFSFLGGALSYSEWGKFIRTGAQTATKTSTWLGNLGQACTGECSDELTLQ